MNTSCAKTNCFQILGRCLTPLAGDWGYAGEKIRFGQQWSLRKLDACQFPQRLKPPLCALKNVWREKSQNNYCDEKSRVSERDRRKQSPRHWLRMHQGNEQRRHQSRFEGERASIAKPAGKLSGPRKWARRVECRKKGLSLVIRVWAFKGKHMENMSVCVRKQ